MTDIILVVVLTATTATALRRQPTRAVVRLGLFAAAFATAFAIVEVAVSR